MHGHTTTHEMCIICLHGRGLSRELSCNMCGLTPALLYCHVLLPTRRYSRVSYYPRVATHVYMAWLLM